MDGDLEVWFLGTEHWLWGLVLFGMTLAYGFTLLGVYAVRQHNVSSHGRRMTIACTLVGMWLVAYVTKQFLFGRDQFIGTNQEYWQLYVPILFLHTLLALVTSGLGILSLNSGLRRLRHPIGVGTIIKDVIRHRVLDLSFYRHLVEPF